jgi:hypothetical protein
MIAELELGRHRRPRFWDAGCPAARYTSVGVLTRDLTDGQPARPPPHANDGRDRLDLDHPAGQPHLDHLAVGQPRPGLPGPFWTLGTITGIRQERMMERQL